MAAQTGPDATSADYDAMKPYWDMVETILDGAAAMREAAELYLPKFPEETAADYEYRRQNAKFTNIYADIVGNLASKPFAKEVSLAEGASGQVQALAEDIDGRGNNQNVFAAHTFFGGINNAIDWIWVDYKKAAPRPDGRPLTLEDQREQGLRPYWVRVPASRVLAVYADTVKGREVIVHARLRENTTKRVGFAESCVERIRVLNREPVYAVDADGVETDIVVDYLPATFEVYEKKATGRRNALQWEVVEQGPITIGEIPLVPFITGRRKEGSWRFLPPMQDAAFTQVEHYQQETALKAAKELVAYPMLAGNGVTPAVDQAGNPTKVPVGPKTVLYAPPYGDSGQHGGWTFVKTDAEGLRFLASDIEATEKQLRELGRQPLTATAGITVVTAAVASQKASSAVQAWALSLKDALEQAWKFTVKYLADVPEPEVVVFTDFALESGDEKGPETLTSARKNGDLSRETYWAELKRRGILSGDFDATKEQDRLAEELADPDTEADITAATTPPANDRAAA